jgi:hypothetical protein
MKPDITSMATHMQIGRGDITQYLINCSRARRNAPACLVWFCFGLDGRHLYAQFGLDLVWI